MRNDYERRIAIVKEVSRILNKDVHGLDFYDVFEQVINKINNLEKRLKPFQVFFKIDNYPHECLVVDESEEKAKEYIEQEYLGAENVVVFPIENRMMVEMNMF